MATRIYGVFNEETKKMRAATFETRALAKLAVKKDDERIAVITFGSARAQAKPAVDPEKLEAVLTSADSIVARILASKK